MRAKRFKFWNRCTSTNAVVLEPYRYELCAKKHLQDMRSHPQVTTRVIGNGTVSMATLTTEALNELAREREGRKRGRGLRSQHARFLKFVCGCGEWFLDHPSQPIFSPSTSSQCFLFVSWLP